MNGNSGWGRGSNCGTPYQVPAGDCSRYVQCLVPLGITGTSLASAASENITVTPKSRMRPLRFFVTVAGWTINQVTVAMSTFLQTPIPSALYLGTVTDLTVSWGAFDQLNPMILNVTNGTGATAVFSAVLTCQAEIMSPTF